jgi:D-3-phosphoglycerate dehydrogenase / 2-oxoglutarate reductase
MKGSLGMEKIVYTDGFDKLDYEKSIFAPLGCEIISQMKHKGEENLIEMVTDADYVVVQFAPITAKVINSMKKSKLILRVGIGYDNVDGKAAAAKGIPLCNIPDFCIDEVADHTLAMIMAAARKIVPIWEVIKKGGWKLPVPIEQLFVLKKMTVGLIGYGRIGREVAMRLKGFKSNVMIFDPVVDNSVIIKDGFIPASLEEIYAKSDLISLHCPSNDKTKYMINAGSIAKMKRGVMLVNTSRGTLIKTEDLIKALESGQVGVAALDVTDPEPINTDSPLLKMDNVIINCHCASGSVNAMENFKNSIINTLMCAVQGKKLPNVVNGVV